MSRYIDADALIIDYYDDYETKDDEYTYAYVSEAQIYSAPSIDIVRCKECIHYGRDSERNTYGCNLHSIGMTPSDFCSYGEREDE